MPTYQAPQPIDREAAVTALSSDDPRVAADAILRLALHDDDGAWVEEQAVRLLDSPHGPVRGVAATALGHVARLHRTIKPATIGRLTELLDDPDPDTAGRAENALDDISMFGRV